jgi:glycosyltransferase involved in cell wall biosynthesis
MKILWLSNKVLTDYDQGSTGTWLDAMARGLSQSGKITLGNIATGSASKVIRQDCGPIQQWIVPSTIKLRRNGLPAEETVADIVKSAEDFSPDLIHVWGTESFWGLLTARKLVRGQALLEMQGVKGAIAKVYHGGLSLCEQMSCIGLKEVVRQSTIGLGRKRFEIWGEIEREIISQHNYIAVQTKWVEAQVKTVNYGCSVFKTALLLREPFYNALPWKFLNNHVVFCSVAYPSPFKGLHIAINATAILRNRFPDIKLRIAGAHQKNRLRQDGYIAWLNRRISKLGLGKNVEWLGALDATETVAEMKMASAMVIPSYIENCSNAMQEAMKVGTPVIASFAGGLPSLARDEESALFFPVGDEIMCAHQLSRVLTECELAERLSKKAKGIAATRNDSERIVSRQLEIYQQVISENT